MLKGMLKGGVLEALAMIGKRIPGVGLGGRAASGVGRGVKRVLGPSPIEPFIQERGPKGFLKYIRGKDAWKGKHGWVGKKGKGQGAIDEGDLRIAEAIIKRPRNLAKIAGIGAAGAGAYSLLPEDEIPIPEWAEDLEDSEEVALEEEMDIADEEELSDVPSWLRTALAGLGAYAGYKRSGLSGGLMGGAGGYGLGEVLQRNPGAYDWIKKNPEIAAGMGLLGANALGLDKGWGGESPDIPEYQGYTPLTYQNLGGYAPSSGVPQMEQGGIIGALKKYFGSGNGEDAPDFPLPSGLLPENLPGRGWSTQPDSISREDSPGWQNLPGRGWSTQPDSSSRWPGWQNLPGRGWNPQPDSSNQRPTPFLTPMAQGGISGGEGGLGGLRTGLRDAIVNSIDDPNRQGINSFVPSMLKAYDEIPKLQAGGIATGTGRDADKSQYFASPTSVQPSTQTMGTIPQANTYDTKADWQKTQQHVNPNQQFENPNSHDYGKPVVTQGTNMHTGSNANAADYNRPDSSIDMSGIGTGYDPMTAAIGQNVLEQRAGMGGLGSNMTDISLTRGMAPHMAGMQNQWYNQQMGMQGFNQRERENQARFGMQRAALENQSGVNPYAASMMRNFS